MSADLVLWRRVVCRRQHLLPGRRSADLLRGQLPQGRQGLLLVQQRLRLKAPRHNHDNPKREDSAVSHLAPRNSVGSGQVIDGSLKSRDFAAGQIPVASTVLSRSVPSVVLTIGDSLQMVNSLPISTPGTYAIWATAHLSVLRDTGVQCKLIAGATADESVASFPAGEGLQTATLSHLVVHEFAEAGSVDLRCGSASKGKVVTATGVTVIAMRLASG